MSFYAVAMLVILLGSVWFGFWKGLAWQIASLAAIVVSYFVAVNFRGQVAQYIQAQEPFNRIAAMLILFLGTSVVIWIIYGRVKGSLKRMELRGFDRQIGALVGGLKGAILCMVATIFAVSLLGKNAQLAIDSSKLGPYVVEGIAKASAFVPTDFNQFIQPHLDFFHQRLAEARGGQAPANQNNGTLGGGLGSTYQVGGTPQNPNNLPQTGYQSQQSQWQWQTPNTPTNGGFNQPNNSQFNQPQNNQPQYQQPQYNNQQPAASNWPQTQQGGAFSGAGYQQPQQQQQTTPIEDFRNGASQAIQGAIGERARQLLEGGR